MKSFYKKILNKIPAGTTHVCLSTCIRVPCMDNPYLMYFYRKTANEWYFKRGREKYWTMMKSEPDVNLLSLDSIRILARQFPDSSIEKVAI